jgi:hypothetical protein
VSSAGDQPDEAGSPADGTTLVAVLQGYATAGWSADLTVTPEGRVRCPRCGADSDGAEIGYQSVRRLEGASDPGDEMAVYALTCPRCLARGTLVLHYAADAAPEAVTLLHQLAERRSDTSALPPSGPPGDGPGVAGPDDAAA